MQSWWIFECIDAWNRPCVAGSVCIHMHTQYICFLHSLSHAWVKVIAHRVRKFRTKIFARKKKQVWPSCLNHVYTLPPKLSSVMKKSRSEIQIVCVFASVACILIGKDEKYEKNWKTHAKISDSVCNDLKCCLYFVGTFIFCVVGCWSYSLVVIERLWDVMPISLDLYIYIYIYWQYEVLLHQPVKTPPNQLTPMTSPAVDHINPSGLSDRLQLTCLAFSRIKSSDGYQP